MLYKVLKSIITDKSYLEAGDTIETMQTKLDVFYARGRITEAQYKELSDMLQAQKTA